MTSYFVVSAAAFLTAGLTFYTGFGLGTLLMPVYALFFPVEVAVAATAVVHGANNALKIALVGKKADRSIVLRFGIPAILAAVVGASLLGWLSGAGEVVRYELGPRTAVVTPVKLVMGCLILVFAAFEVLPALRKLQFDRRLLFVGGLFSGFFGGLSGHQGALRSAFLVKVGISTEAFVGTNAVLGFMVDAARLAAYSGLLFVTAKSISVPEQDWPLVFAGVAGAALGVFTARRFLEKVKMDAIQTVTGVLLFAIAVALGAGVI